MISITQRPIAKFLFVFFILAGTLAVPEKTAAQRPRDLTDSSLLDLVQKQTFRYFWDFAHPVSGIARERSNVADYGPETVTTGGSGFGVMSIIVASERKWISRDTAAGQLLKIVRFLRN